NLYNKESEGCVLWNDADLGIDWNCANPVLSEKDLAGTPFKSFVSPF
ncbi:UNVERIFIED_CONTAM: dTDP-4-dehydrorhamnose 3,5-epimerase family protein, partial [Salmonella enterica subsp. enterica serovar Weltevreden]